MKTFIVSLCMVWGALALQPVQAQSASLLTALWNAEYFNNPYLSGRAAFVRQDTGIGFDWGTASPGDGVPADNFSVRWGKGGYLPAGTYRFIVTADEGFRLSVNDEVLIDQWDNPQPGATFGAEIFLEAGTHRLQVDYREFDETAFVYLDWGLAPGGQAVPQSSTAGTTTATVTASLLNVRSEPRIANNVTNRIGLGQQFPVLDYSADGNWVELDLGNNTRGWVTVDYVTIDGAPRDASTANLTGITLRSNVNLLVRSRPASNADVIGMLRPNEIVPIRGRNIQLTWWYVWDGARLGWVNARYVTVSSDVTPLDIIVITPPATTPTPTLTATPAD